MSGTRQIFWSTENGLAPDEPVAMRPANCRMRSSAENRPYQRWIRPTRDDGAEQGRELVKLLKSWLELTNALTIGDVRPFREATLDFG